MNAAMCSSWSVAHLIIIMIDTIPLDSVNMKNSVDWELAEGYDIHKTGLLNIVLAQDTLPGVLCHKYPQNLARLLP